MEERGDVLAQGRRGHVAVDYKGEKYSVSRYVGVKAKEVRARLGDADGLPNVEQAKECAAKQITDRLKELQEQQQQELNAKREREAAEQKRMQEVQAKEAAHLSDEQAQRQQQEELARQERLRRGLWGLWDRVTGKRKETEQRNAQEAAQAHERDKQQVAKLEEEQRLTIKTHHEDARAERQNNEQAVDELQTDIKWLDTVLVREMQTQQTYAEQQLAEVTQIKAEQANLSREPKAMSPTTDSYADRQRFDAVQRHPYQAHSLER